MRRVAIVDDNAESRLLVQFMLQGRYEVIEFDSREGALAGLPLCAPHIVLLDLLLPGEGSGSLLPAIRGEPRLRHVPVIAFTAHASKEDRARCLAAGFDDHLGKPLTDKRVLLAAIERALRGRSTEDGSA